VIGGYSEHGLTNSVEVIDLETSATTCNNFTSFPSKFEDGVGSLGLRNEPMACQGMNFIYLPSLTQPKNNIT
jgi:hypothetical protein